MSEAIERTRRNVRERRMLLAGTLDTIVANRNQAEGSEKAQLRAAAIHVEQAIRNLDTALSKVTPR